MSLNGWLKLEQDNKGLKLTILRIFVILCCSDSTNKICILLSLYNLIKESAAWTTRKKGGTHIDFPCSFRAFSRRVSGYVPFRIHGGYFWRPGVGLADHPGPSCIQLGPWKSPSACLCVLFTSVKTKVRPRMAVSENPAHSFIPTNPQMRCPDPVVPIMAFQSLLRLALDIQKGKI